MQGNHKYINKENIGKLMHKSGNNQIIAGRDMTRKSIGTFI